MVKINPSLMVASMSGKLAGSYFRTQNGSIILSSKPSVRNRHSYLQERSRGIFALCQREWSLLSENQRNNWFQGLGFNDQTRLTYIRWKYLNYLTYNYFERDFYLEPRIVPLPIITFDQTPFRVYINPVAGYSGVAIAIFLSPIMSAANNQKPSYFRYDFRNTSGATFNSRLDIDYRNLYGRSPEIGERIWLRFVRFVRGSGQIYYDFAMSHIR